MTTNDLDRAASRYRAARAELDAARDQLRETIRSALADGMRQADILRATDHVWTREQLRQLARSR